MKVRTILLAAFCLALCAADGPVRTWTDSTGKYTVEAELVGVDNGKVRLKTNDGSIVTVPLVKMSAGDRAFLQQRLPERKDEAPNEPPPTDSTGTSNGKPTETFKPEDFKLSDLLENLDDGNHFKIPAKARPFLHEVLDSGTDVQFKTTNRGGTKAYISSDLSPNIWINLAYPSERLGEAICHEMLHFEDMQRFKPITRINRTGLAADQAKVFQPVIRDLVNMISHEYVKEQLEQFGYEKPMSDNADNRMKNMTSGLAALEKNFVSVSQQLAKAPGKKGSLGMAGLQTVYQNLLLMTLRDQLLFDGAYASDIDEMIVRFQAILDFIHQNTSEDPRFKKVYLKVKEPADAIRTSCKKYQDSDGSTAERYALLTDTLNHIYEHVGISFALILKPGEPPLLTADSTFFKPGESFLLDGKFNFSDVRIFVPVQPVGPGFSRSGPQGAESTSNTQETAAADKAGQAKKKAVVDGLLTPRQIPLSLAKHDG